MSGIALILGIGFIVMTILVVIAVNKLDDLRLENKLLQQEIRLLKQKEKLRIT